MPSTGLASCPADGREGGLVLEPIVDSPFESDSSELTRFRCFGISLSPLSCGGVLGFVDNRTEIPKWNVSRIVSRLFLHHGVHDGGVAQ